MESDQKKMYTPMVSSGELIVYMPTNSGLGYTSRMGFRKMGRLFPRTKMVIKEERGELIADAIDAEMNGKYPVFGVTGEDLLRERYRRSGLTFKLGLKGNGPYENAVFGLPTLCILARGGVSFEQFKQSGRYELDSNGVPVNYCKQLFDFRGKRIVIPKKYAREIERLILWEEGIEGFDYTQITKLDGQVERTAATDLTIDAAVDIVLTGKTAKECGLGLVAVISSSDGVLIGNNAAKVRIVNR